MRGFGVRGISEFCHFKKPVLAVAGCASLSELDDFTAAPASLLTVFFAVA